MMQLPSWHFTIEMVLKSVEIIQFSLRPPVKLAGKFPG